MDIEGAVCFDNPSFKNSIIGVTTDGRLVYSYERMVVDLMEEEGWSEEDAIDWISYNTIRSLDYIENGPIVVYENYED